MIKSSKYFSLIIALILLIGCESESFNIPGKTTLISPENVKSCESGVSISDTQSEVTFSWSESDYTDYTDTRDFFCRGNGKIGHCTTGANREKEA